MFSKLVKVVKKIIKSNDKIEAVKPEIKPFPLPLQPSALYTFTTSAISLGYMHGMVRHNNGYFSSSAQHYMMFKNCSNIKEYNDTSILRMFPEVEWVYPFSVVRTFGSKKVMTQYMMLGNDTGICYKLKQANRSELEENIGNGYIVVWERVDSDVS